MEDAKSQMEREARKMQYVVETQNLTKVYGTYAAVEQVNLHVPKGKIYGLLGRNGAGKTTLMSMLLNLTDSTSGEVTLFDGRYSSNQKQIYGRVGSIIETPGFYENLTGRENLELLAKLRGIPKKKMVQQALEIVGLENENKKTFSQYSLGMKQRLGIAAAVMHEPELLILDEPINGLDPVGIALVRQYLEELAKEKGVTILISSHILSEIEQMADVIGVMNQGKLIEEVTMSWLHENCRRYIEVEVSEPMVAAKLIEDTYQARDYRIAGSTIQIFEGIGRCGEVNKLFVENGLVVSKLIVAEERLEDYFAELIGGEGIA